MGVTCCLGLEGNLILGCLKGVLSELKSFRSVFDLFLVCFKGEARVPESGVSYWYERSALQSVTIRLATTLVATKNVFIFFFSPVFFPLFFPFFFSLSSPFLIEGVLGSKNLFSES